MYFFSEVSLQLLFWYQLVSHYKILLIMNSDASQLCYENFAITYMLLLLCPNITN